VTSVPSTVGIVASGEDVLNDAVFWVDAGLSSVSSGALTNLGTGGSALNAVFGNSTSVDSFDPALLTHTGTNYLYLPGVAGNHASTTNNSAYRATSSVSCRFVVSLANWTPSASAFLGGLYEGSTGQRSYLCAINLTDGRPMMFMSSDGVSAATSIFATQAPTVSPNGYLAIRCDWLAAGPTVRFYTKQISDNAYDDVVNDAGWTQLGSDRTASVPVSLHQSTAPLYCAGYSTASGTEMAFRASAFKIDGVLQFAADFTAGITSGAQTTFTESSANAATVTINRATSGRKSVAVAQPILLFGTDDYLEVVDNDLLDFGAGNSFTVLAALRAWGNPSSNTALVSKVNFGSLPSAGWQLYWNGTTLAPKIVVSDGTVLPNVGSNTTLSSGAIGVIGVARDVTADLLRTYTNTVQGSTTTDTTTGSLANALPLRIGTRADSVAQTSDFELVAAAVWRRALNANEIATIVNRYT